MKENAFFRMDDPKVSELAGVPLPADWWSRPYEYAWAIQYAKSGQAVADMGCGWMPRPFKDALAQICSRVYAVDADARLLEWSRPDNMEFIVADFTQEIPGVEPHSLDRIFCISVLEDLGDKISAALKTFKSLLKPDGLIVATCDVHYDANRPLGQYPGVRLLALAEAIEQNSLAFREEPDFDKTGAVYHYPFNLTPFHFVLVNA